MPILPITPVPVFPAPGAVFNVAPTPGGTWTPWRSLDGQPTGMVSNGGINSDAKHVAKGQPGILGSYYFGNQAASVRYLKIYDTNATPPNAGVFLTPVLTLPLPATAAGHIEFAEGIIFKVGIAVRVTTGVADTDTGAPTANDVVLNLMIA